MSEKKMTMNEEEVLNDDILIEQTNIEQSLGDQAEDYEKIQPAVMCEPYCIPDDKFHEKVFATLADISSEIANLKYIYEDRFKYDKTKDEAFDRLYNELDAYKKNSAFNAIRPLFLDLILLFDRIDNILEIKDQVQDKINISELLASFREEVIEILYRHGVDLIQNSSSTFDPLLQQAISIQKTEDECENNAIAKVVRKGFKYQDRIVRPEEVIVKKYSKKI